MWPWGHLALGYLCYAGYRGLWSWKTPSGWPVILLAFGTQFPDLIDKPLAYWLAILPEGRSLTHSLLIAVPLCLAIYLLARRYQQGELGMGFAIGWGSHLIGDAVNPVMKGSYHEVTFLVWPLLPIPDYEASDFLFHAQKLLVELINLNSQRLMSPGDEPFILQIWLSILVFVLWVAQGMPPAGMFRRLWLNSKA